MSDVTRWLERLGLGQYAQVFAANDIDFDLLSELSDPDLEKLGIASLGHRKRLLAAIGQLAEPTAVGDAPDEVVPEGERRPVTVMFADLTGFTSLSRKLDAEDIHHLLEQFFAAVDEVIESHGGTIDKHIGDCTMGLFGAPIAHGDDCLRAVRAALAVREAVQRLADKSEHPIGVHVGIATGEVVASTTGSTLHSAYTVTGDSVNVAARLTDRAGDGEILLAGAVYDEVAGRVEAEPVGALHLDGIAEPLDSWRLTGLGGRHAAKRSLFVGRRAELHQFGAALASCRDLGIGATLLVRGEAGIGKTRLIQEFSDHALAAGFACHSALILDFGAGVERDPLLALVRSLLGLPIGAGEPQAQRAIAHAIDERRVEVAHAVFLYDLLGVPQPAELRAVINAMDDRTRNEGRLATAAALSEGTSRQQGLVLVIEDAHWADRATLEAAARLAMATARAPIILVITTRIEGDPLDAAWRARVGGASVMTLDLARLSENDARALATAVSTMPALIERCLERAEGNPLFLEQLLRSVDEDATVPESVQSVVLARVDRLEAVDRRALQAASALGQRFEAAAVQFMLEEPNYDFDRLVQRYLVRPEGAGYFLFAHALIRDGVYASLLRGRARGLHARAAEWFAQRDPILFAEHLALAGDGRAAQAFLAAAEQQRADYRNERALELIASGRAIAAEPGDRFALACAEGEVLLDLGRAHDALEAFAAAEQFAVQPEQIARVKFGLAGGRRLTDQIGEALRLLEGAEAAARSAERIDLLARIHHLRGNLYFPSGRLRECLSEQIAAHRAAEQAGSPELIALALGGLGDAEYANCLMVSALAHFRECVALARQHGLGRIEVANASMVAATHCSVGPLAGAYEEALTNIETAQRVGHARGEIISHHAAFFALLYAGDFDGALAHVQQAQALTERIRAKRFEPENLAFQGEVARRKGQRSHAIALAEKAWSLCDETTMHYLGPTLLGILAQAVDDPERRRWALDEGDRLLTGGSLSHNHFMFRPAAIDASLDAGAWDDADRHAAALEAAFAAEPVPFVRFLVDRAHALAAHGRGNIDQAELARVAATGRKLGYVIYVEELERATAATGA